MEGHFQQLPGVTDVKVDLDNDAAYVGYDPGKFKPKEQVGKIVNDRFEVSIPQ